MKQFRLRAIILSILAAVVATAAVLSAVFFVYIGSSGRTLLAANWYVQNRFVGTYDETLWLDGTLDAMARSLGDRWSYYSDAEAYAYQSASRDGSFVGIGVTVRYEGDAGMLLASVYPDSPAERAGLLVGERITAVAGERVTEQNMYALTERIGGEEGTEIELEITGVDGALRTLAVIRARVASQPVLGELLEDKVAKVSYSRFYMDSAAKFEVVVDDLLAQGMRGMVLDLRSNGGGYLPELTEVLDYLLPEGAIFTAIDHNGVEHITFSDADWAGVPIVVLVNDGTYSAAEFCAAQLRESLGAPIVGAATSGKGYSQQAFTLPNGGALNISSAEYRTGGGVSLAESGIIPDYEVENTAEEDRQMAKALKVMREMLAENY